MSALHDDDVRVGHSQKAGPHTTACAIPWQSSVDAFELLVAPPSGSWTVAARLTLGTRLEDAVARELRFDPWNSGGGLVPAGIINRLRGAAYRGSRRGSAT